MDFGLGCLQGLGLKFKYNNETYDDILYGKHLTDLANNKLIIDPKSLNELINNYKNLKIICCVDVNTNISDCVEVFGRQKGLLNSDLKLYKHNFIKINDIFFKLNNKNCLFLNGSGAAGALSGSLA